MFVHSVYFWLKKGLSQEELKKFVDRGEALKKISSVRQGYFGTPAATDRPVIDRSYSYGLVVSFDDAKGHDAYQVDPIHDRFRELAPLWDKVIIYDFES